MDCLIWGTEAAQGEAKGDFQEINSPRAGGLYRVTGTAVPALSNLTLHEKAKLTTWLVDQRRLGVEAPSISTVAIEQIQLQRALTVALRKERFFRAIMDFGLGLRATIKLGGQVDDAYRFWRNRLAAWTESLDAKTQDVVALATLLAEDGFLASDAAGHYRLTSAGWNYYDTLSATGADTLQVFVAMWFSPEMTEVYDRGIAPAIRDAGYIPLKIDSKEHNNKIDDEIITEIRRSRFLIADFTSPAISIGDEQVYAPRGGVYYEAGFARGLSMDVISTVRADQIQSVHFDTRQISHVLWTDAGELRDRLYNRIGATIGEAPGAPGRGQG